MSKEDSAFNPYQSPHTDASAESADEVLLQVGERIPFAGIVRREVLCKALAGRFSWAALGTLVVGALICFGAMPPTFLNPFVRVGKLRVDPIAELLGVGGIGFAVLAMWHVMNYCTRWGVRRRERYFLKRIADLYQTQLSGSLEHECIYIREGRCESWLRWVALNYFQANDDVAFIEWGSGAGGMTVLTKEMFSADAEFQRSCDLFQHRVSPAFDDVKLTQLTHYFFPGSAPVSWPSRDETIAECAQTISYREVMIATLVNIPVSILKDSRPLHYFFAILGAAALLLAEHQPSVTLTVAGIWLGVLILAAVLSAVSVRQFVFRNQQRLLASKTRFTANEIHVATTVGYFRAPLSEFTVMRCDPQQIVLAQKGHEEIRSKLVPKYFDTETQWQALLELLSPLA